MPERVFSCVHVGARAGSGYPVKWPGAWSPYGPHSEEPGGSLS